MERDYDAAQAAGKGGPEQSPQTGPRPGRLERRLAEAFDELWDNFVDPTDALYDVDGTRWNAVGAETGSADACGLRAGQSPQPKAGQKGRQEAIETRVRQQVLQMQVPSWFISFREVWVWGRAGWP